MHELFEYVEDKPKRGDVSLALILSIALHLTVVSWFIVQYYKTPPKAVDTTARFVELVPPSQQQQQMQQQRERQFMEAPGPKTKQPTRNDAPLSDADRKASMPRPTGDRPTIRPGTGQGMYNGGPRGMQAPPPEPAQQNKPSPESLDPLTPSQGSKSIQPYRGGQQNDENPPQVDWKAVIKDAATAQRQQQQQQRIPLGNLDAGGDLGGDLGIADTGPMSFETTWFDWGPYAASMVAKIRYHWYENMPQIIRTGLRGVVVIRFTIQRNGQITDIEMLSSSGVPPFDNAAKRALELASPLNALPPNFPKDHERVVARFFYNMRPQ